MCVLGSRGSGPPGLGPWGPGLVIFGPNPLEFTGFGVVQGSKPYKFIGFAWDRFVCVLGGDIALGETRFGALRPCLRDGKIGEHVAHSYFIAQSMIFGF